MIILPPVNITPSSRTSTTQKSKRRLYATEPEKEQNQQPHQKDRRSNLNRRYQVIAEQLMDRRAGQDRRKGRINVVI